MSRFINICTGGRVRPSVPLTVAGQDFVEVKLEASQNKGSLCAFFLLPLGAEQQQRRLGEKGVEDETKHMQHGLRVHRSSGHPRVAVCVCV